MAASPAEPTPGATAGKTPNGNAPPKRIRRPQPANPLVQRKAPRRPPPPPPKTATSSLPNAPGSKTSAAAAKPRGPGGLQKLGPGLIAPGDQPKISTVLGARQETTISGFSDPTLAAKDFTDYPLILSREPVKDGIRLHVARFVSKQNIDVTNEEEFIRPLRLSRRDSRAPLPGVKDSREGTEEPPDEEKVKQELLRAQREAQREAERAEIAPSTNPAHSKRPGFSVKKTHLVYRKDETEEQRARTKLKYEEALPWHLEDFDNKQSWVGNYEAALSETFVQIVFKDGKFYLTPIEKFYKFHERRNFKNEEDLKAAEIKREKSFTDPDWLMRQRGAEQVKREAEKNKNAIKGLYVGPKERGGVSTGRPAIKREDDDYEEVDFDDDVADDEEDPLFEGDGEDQKAAESRIKRDQLKANLFNLKDEKSYDREEQLEKKEKERQKMDGKKLRRALKKRERNYTYDSDSDDNPFSEQSESSDSDLERQKEEQQKKEAEEKKLKPGQTGANTSGKGNSATANKSAKHLQPGQRAASVKRSGSPSLSEASGNESSRKRQKKARPASSNLAPGNPPSGPPSRPRSPANANDLVTNRAGPVATGAKIPKKPPAPLGPDLKRPRGMGAGSGSEGEGAGSGGEMSDGTRKRVKPNPKIGPSKNTSPNGSRAGSPGPPAVSRAGSPGASLPPLPTAAEIREALPEGGITITDLLKRFAKGSITSDQERKDRFFKTLKTVSTYEKASKLLKPLKASAAKTD